MTTKEITENILERFNKEFAQSSFLKYTICLDMLKNLHCPPVKFKAVKRMLMDKIFPDRVRVKI